MADNKDHAYDDMIAFSETAEYADTASTFGVPRSAIDAQLEKLTYTQHDALIQQLRELTGTQHEHVDILLATYRNQYTRGWTKSRTGRDLASDAPDAEREGYEDNECGLPKWTQMAQHSFLDTELA